MVTWKSNEKLERVLVITAPKKHGRSIGSKRSLTSPIPHRKKKKKRLEENNVSFKKGCFGNGKHSPRSIPHERGFNKESKEATYREILGGNNKQANRSTSLTGSEIHGASHTSFATIN